MIAVSQKVTEIQERKKKVIRRRVRFRKRFWDIEQQKYVLETTPTEVRAPDLRGISPARESLDRKGINIFESGNVTIELENRDNKWNVNNPDGLLAADSVARQGYKIKLMEMIVDIFYELADGTESAPIPIFTGRVLRPEFDPDADTVRFVVESRAILLKLANAENVSDDKTNQLLVGTIDGVNDTFTSPDTGVGIVDAVRVSESPQRLGADVKVSTLNDPDVGATFKFTTPPPISSDPRADYKVWKKDNAIEILVGLLADEAGIQASERDIQPVTFPNQVLNKEIFTTQADWETGTFVDTESTSSPGDILLQDLAGSFGDVDDFEDGNFTNNPTWTVLNGSWTVTSFLSSLRLRTGPIGIGFAQTIRLPFTKAEGTWEFIHAYTSPAVPNSIPLDNFPIGGFEFRFMETSGGDFYALTGGADSSGANPSHTFRLKKFVGGLSTLGSYTLGGGVYTSNTAFKHRITRDNITGDMKIYLDGVLKITVTDLGVTTSDFIKARGDGTFSGVGDHVNYFDDLRHTDSVIVPPATVPANGTWVSPVIDTGVGNPILYGLLDRIDVIPPGTSILYETATSDDGSSFPDGFVPITGGGLIDSVVRRFIKVRITLTSDAGQVTTPIVNEIAINFTTTSIGIVLANFLDLTVFQAVTELAKIANFEWGFSRAGRMFFRERTFSISPVLTIELKNLKSFSKITDGSERVRNSIRAAYGAHIKITTPETRGDSRPNSFDDHGFRPLSVGSTKLLLDPDADIATGISIGYFEEFKNARNGLELGIDLRPQLELGDTILLRIRDAVPSPPWHVGDSSRAIGDKDIRLYGEEQQAAYEVLARILSLRNDTERKISGLELERII